MTFSIKDIAHTYGYSWRVTRNHIQDLIREEKFKPTSRGKRFNENDCREISILLGFEFEKLKPLRQ